MSKQETMIPVHEIPCHEPVSCMLDIILTSGAGCAAAGAHPRHQTEGPEMVGAAVQDDVRLLGGSSLDVLSWIVGVLVESESEPEPV